ncbi:AraC family transcriptional regulator [Cohnella zeiphila]|uniref:Helix-turn-helix transcriptional regulator n=1 Tax=Cohnella zeiphila TaxID=2761120 RepID=A0A7X0SWC5_9BACL|nr:AraC family transcriptional regulator [Cohnella zeiphila]MBB6735153.1 helix-turn-helix transcriptional regulator [Cohnella zeiphila]
MVYMNIPYALDDSVPVPAFRFQSIWKVQANDTYQAVQPRGFPSAGIFVTYEGRGTFTHPDRRDELGAGTYMIVPAGLPCSYRCEGGDWKFFFIQFDSLDIALQLELTVGRPAATAQMPEAVRLCKRLIDSLIVHPAGYGMAAQLYAQELFLLFGEERASAGRNRHPELDDVLFRMHRNIGRPLPVDELVRQSGLSRTVFFARFRSRTGMSPSRYMLELKLASAKATLETTDSSVKEIAAALHFYDEFHFSKLFKQRYGVSPRAYRQSLPPHLGGVIE